jgi:hypothetical protein
MADPFQFDLVSPERLLMSEKVAQVVVPGTVSSPSRGMRRYDDAPPGYRRDMAAGRREASSSRQLRRHQRRG